MGGTVAIHHRATRPIGWESRSATLRRSGGTVRVYPVVAEMARCRGLGARPIDIIAADTVAEIGLLWLIEVMAFGRLSRRSK